MTSKHDQEVAGADARAFLACLAVLKTHRSSGASELLDGSAVVSSNTSPWIVAPDVAATARPE